LKHVDEDHIDMRFEAAKPALVRIGGADYGAK
jgi:hypothetical protein